MGSNFTFGIYIISYSRFSRGMVTGKNFSNPKHVVRASQYDDYLNNGFVNVIPVEDSLIDNYDKAFNWVVENTPEDVVAIVDDDIKAFKYQMGFWAEKIDDADDVEAEFCRLAQLIHDLEIGVAFSPATSTPYVYSGEFTWFSIPGAFKVVNKACVKAKMDDSIPRHSDIDYVLQELLSNRICLATRHFFDIPYEDKESATSGSCYSASDIYASANIMSAKWGKCFQYVKTKNVPKIMVDR